MLKVFKIFFTIVLVALLCDVTESENFEESNTFKSLLDYGEEVLKGAKKSINKASDWVINNVPLYYNSTSVFLKPYIKLSYDLSNVLKRNVVSLTHHVSQYLKENFPAIQDSMNFLMDETIDLTNDNVEVFNPVPLHNYTSIDDYDM